MNLALFAATPSRNQTRLSKIFVRIPDYICGFNSGWTKHTGSQKCEMLDLLKSSPSLGGVETAQVNDVSFGHIFTPLHRRLYHGKWRGTSKEVLILTQARQADSKLQLVGELQTTIHINTAEIPDYKRDELARGAIELMRQVFAIPGEEESYRVWLAKRKAATAAK